MSFFAQVIVEPGVATLLMQNRVVAALNSTLDIIWNMDSTAVGNCCCILANLSMDKRYKLDVCECLKNMVRVLRVHDPNKEHSVNAAHHVCTVLHNLLSDPACADRVVRIKDAVRALVRAACSESSNALVDRAMMAILALARSGHAAGVAELVEAGAVSTALRVSSANERARLLLVCLAGRLSSRGAVFHATKAKMLACSSADKGFLLELLSACDTQQAEVRARKVQQAKCAQLRHLPPFAG
jgi:hypothetical protein